MNNLTKKQRRKLQMECIHNKKEKMVTFKNGSKHLAVRCDKCGKFFGYKKQGNHDPAVIPVDRLSGLEYDDGFTYEDTRWPSHQIKYKQSNLF